MGKLDVKKQHKFSSLLDAAFELFTSNGVSHTSISEISQRAGVAKGTFYLYFNDKLDIRDRLIAHKSSQLFRSAIEDMEQGEEITLLEDKIIFIADHIIGDLEKDKRLLTFISKNLSWGVFKNALCGNGKSDADFSLPEYFAKMTAGQVSKPEIMLYMIIELVGSSIYSVVLSGDPIPIEEYKPYLYNTIRDIVSRFKI